MAKTSSGILLLASGTGSSSTFMKAKLRRLPQNDPPVREKVSEKPQKNHWNVTTAIASVTKRKGERTGVSPFCCASRGGGTSSAGEGRTTHGHEQQTEGVLSPDETAVQESQSRNHQELNVVARSRLLLASWTRRLRGGGWRQELPRNAQRPVKRRRGGRTTKAEQVMTHARSPGS